MGSKIGIEAINEYYRSDGMDDCILLSQISYAFPIDRLQQAGQLDRPNSGLSVLEGLVGRDQSNEW